MLKGKFFHHVQNSFHPAETHIQHRTPEGKRAGSGSLNNREREVTKHNAWFLVGVKAFLQISSITFDVNANWKLYTF